MYSQSLIATLPKAQKSNARFEAVLLEFDIDGNKEKPAWKFLINPRELKFSESANYGKVAPIASAVEFLQYQATSGVTLQINDLILDTWCIGRSLRPLVEGARALMKAKPDQNQFSPMVLAFKWGSKRVAPLVLTSLQWDEQRFLSGETARIRMSMTLEEIPRPLTKAELEEREKRKQDAIADRRESDGKPKRPLTDRQAKSASDAARDYLKQNKDSFTADIQSKISRGMYSLKTDRDSGNVEMISGDQSLGIVLRGLGDKAIANPKITTIPLKPAATLPALK
jgi:hypothetical protein